MRLTKVFLCLSATALALLVQLPAFAQAQHMNARITGNGGGSGKCTFEVVVQGQAEVQIRGGEGRLVTYNGNPAQWKRLDCNQPLPPNPANFKFSGVDGHGQQTLAQDPNSNNGVAVIHIDNGNRGNNEGYTGDITWNGGNNSGNWNNNSGGWNNSNANAGWNGGDRDHDGNWQNGNGNWGGNNGQGNSNWGGQAQMINARISGNGGGSGKCTFEVVVQGQAEVQIRGSQGRLQTVNGNPAQWKRLDCNQPLPRNPTNFRFSGVDGHGQQSLAQDPNSNNGVAIIRIDNGNRGNNEGYTGDITWSGGY